MRYMILEMKYVFVPQRGECVDRAGPDISSLQTPQKELYSELRPLCPDLRVLVVGMSYTQVPNTAKYFLQPLRKALGMKSFTSCCHSGYRSGCRSRSSSRHWLFLPSPWPSLLSVVYAVGRLT